ncbi:MAG: TraB/GumN family protein [Phenylobacterium sp.]|uniref:TraB/GumN family protein n=1 Tax=Phenylobacterium sp. TaxID=1871053 RepID=UPI00271D3759|nr:TraB/GumN family protein [Phenylobacterium sp.]MDO9431886.1 TraB/GumN family protein [Phenylobacterium sp.]
MKRVLGLALAAALFASAASAQVPLTPSAQLPAGAVDPNETLVEELVVTARLPGPAWWRVSDADTTVYVLGAPTVAPKRQQWDQLQFNRRLEGANAVILPFTGLKVKLAGAPGAAVSYLRLKSGKPFEDSLDPAQRERFAAVRTKLGQPADHYKTKHPLAAALILTDDYREKEGLTTADPTKLIKLLAQRSGVKVVQRSYDLGPLLGAVIKTSKAAGAACLDEVMGEIEAGPGRTLAASRAWAQGDVAGALGAERSYERCIAVTPGALTFDARVKGDLTKDIEAALKTPGHVIAVAPLRTLLAQGGVLDQLRAKGYEVKTPGDED